MKEWKVALDAVKKASLLAKSIQRNISPEAYANKADFSPVTLVDLANQALITRVLLSSFPGISVVGEEDTSIFNEHPDLMKIVLQTLNGWLPSPIDERQLLDLIDYGVRPFDPKGRFWTVDPIDGTRGFLRGDQYAVALALIENGRVLFGALGCPNLKLHDADAHQGALLWASSGKGAYQEGLAVERPLPVTVDLVFDVSQARFCESVEKKHASHETHQKIADVLGIRLAPCRMDSQVKYAAIAKGNASIYLRLPRKSDYREKIWDHAAGAIIVTEAGGKVSDFDGNPLLFSCGRTLEKNRGILATNGHLHEKVLAAVGKIS
jgi:3'(2'), 5'-bisphosphate nucleotidase